MSIENDNNENIIYGRLFEEVRAGLNDSEVCSQEAFLGTIGIPPKKISFNRIRDLEGNNFLACIFLSFFQRLPDYKEKEFYKGLDKESILKNVVNKGAYSIRKIELTDCPYKKVKTGIKGKIFGFISGVSSSAFLRRMAKKMPVGIQSRIRKLFY